MPFLSLLLYRQNVSSNPLAFFKIFFFLIYLVWCSLAACICGLMLWIWENTASLLLLKFLLFLSMNCLLVFLLHAVLPFVIVLRFLYILFFFFSSMFSLYFSVLEVFMEISSSLEKFSSVMSSVLIKAPKAFFHQRHCHLSSVYLNCSLSFWFFLRMSIHCLCCSYYPSVLTHSLLFPIKSLAY